MLAATGGGVLFQPGSVPALAAALGGLLDDPARRLELGRRGREAVSRQFNDEVMASRTADLYRQMLA
jgi:glycosyltransferase involved in cell wall biosynthesis